MRQQFQVANPDPAIDGIVWHELDVIGDQRMRLRNSMAVVPKDLELLINEDVPSPLFVMCGVGKHLMGGEDDLSDVLSRIEEFASSPTPLSCPRPYPDGTRDIAAHQGVCLVLP